ncbi:autotransporter outer membrane beta-barrel domain-containing protein [Oceanivirga salmonicida]|uniref:autotransporter outer membrane beta-barrel domain-containing protein n=1 Tax=Oceanivirga salmonicida TaxID=1769291 RepID=UPI0008340E15|nr:autotransporter outer membrane beta-barrel domain-containing protein [Oceanivirga salmonicida]
MKKIALGLLIITNITFALEVDIIKNNVNFDHVYANIGTLHSRKGENQTLAWDDCGKAKTDKIVWGKAIGNYNSLEINNKLNNIEEFGTGLGGVQLGFDYRLKTKSEINNLFGVYATYTGSRSDLSTKKAINKYDSNNISIALNNTTYSKYGSYIDIVGQYTYTNQKFKHVYTADDIANIPKSIRKYKELYYGHNFSMSVEVGRPFNINQSGWLLEPQGQIIYTLSVSKTTKLEAGGYMKKLEPALLHSLRGRVGLRLSNNSGSHTLNTNTGYVYTNLWVDPLKHNFLKALNNSSYVYNNETNNFKLFGEIGVGGQIPVLKNVYLYGDTSFRFGFVGKKYYEFKSNLGMKYNF